MYAGRLFYAFQPADVDTPDKPLIVLFNGGPGIATSAGLLSYGTGRRTVDPAPDAGPVAIENPSRWTAFANLLYIDARQAGFSYGLGDFTRAQTCTFSDVEDASDFVRALLDFLDSHDSLRDRPVILAAESYGGVRATWMLDLLLRYSTEASKGGSDLPRRIQAHYDAVFPDRAGTVIDQTAASKQFGAQVLIQPLVFGHAQVMAQNRLGPLDPFVGPLFAATPPDGGSPDVDPYNTLEPALWSEGMFARAMRTLSDPTEALRLLGADLRTADLIEPGARTTAFHGETPVIATAGDIPDAEAALNQSLTSQLGTLNAGDRYFVLSTNECSPVLSASSGGNEGVFVENLRTVRTFITDARYDSVIYAPAIPSVLQAAGFGGGVDRAPRPGVARPGWFSREPSWRWRRRSRREDRRGALPAVRPERAHGRRLAAGGPGRRRGGVAARAVTEVARARARSGRLHGRTRARAGRSRPKLASTASFVPPARPTLLVGAHPGRPPRCRHRERRAFAGLRPRAAFVALLH